MTTQHLGELTLGGTMPGASAAGIAGVAGINAALPTLQDQLASLLSFAPTPVSFAAQITGLQAMITGLQASITLGLVPPSLSTQLAALAAMIAALQLQISGINAQLTIIADFQNALGAAGVHAIAFQGAVSDFGGELAGRLSTVPGLAPGDPSNALVLLTTVPATWAAMAQVLKVSP